MPSSTLDPESFQDILASAFLVQESLLSVQSSSAMTEVRRLIATRALGVTGAMHLIAGRARNVANATGVAIALVKKDQLVYQAGSGSAASYVGRHVIATLSVSTKVERKCEILRVEDADADSRIGAAICRQWGAKSLLILPIYHDQALSGTLEVFFEQAHTFQDWEVGAYQLMAGVIGEAMSCSSALEQKKCLPAEWPTVPQPIEQIVPPRQPSLSNSGPLTSKDAFGRGCRTAIEEAKKLPRHKASPGLTKSTYRAKRIPGHLRVWKIDGRAVVVVVLVMASWIAYRYRRPVSPLGNSPREKSNAIEPQQRGPLVSGEQGLPKKGTSTPQSACVPTKDVRRSARSTPRRVRVGDEEIDYISEDVTVRHFTRKPALQPVPTGHDQVEYVSEDVTVRHFVPMHAVVPPKADRTTALPVR